MPRLSACSSPPRVAHRRGEKNHAEKNFAERNGLGNAPLGPGAGHAFGEVGEHQHARPLVGIAPAAQDSRRRQDERQRLQGDQRSAGAQRREPELPGEAEDDQRDQRARCGESYWSRSSR